MVGADFPGDEVAISELSALSPEAKGWLGHHIKNSLAVALTGAYAKKYALVDEAVWHIVGDLEKIGIIHMTAKGGGERRLKAEGRRTRDEGQNGFPRARE